MPKDLLRGTSYFTAPSAIFERDDLRAADKLVYLYLCRRAGSDGTSWPSTRRIAQDTSLDVKTVRASIDRLIAAGLLLKTSRKSQEGDHDTNLYTIIHPQGVGENAPYLGEKTPNVGEFAPVGVGEMAPHGGGNGTPEGLPFKENHMKDNNSRAGQGYTPEFEEFWAYYPRKIGKSAAFRVWKARIKEKGVTASMLISAAKHYAMECKLKCRSPDYIKHASTFLGPGRHFEDYIHGVPQEAGFNQPPNNEKPQASQYKVARL